VEYQDSEDHHREDSVVHQVQEVLLDHVLVTHMASEVHLRLQGVGHHL